MFIGIHCCFFPTRQLEVHYNFFENETHGSIVHRAFYNNLEHLYLRWRLTPKQIETMTFEQIKEHYSILSERYSYEMSVPTPTAIQKAYQLVQARKYKEAGKLSKAILEQNPDLSEAHFLFGLFSLANGMIEPAKENFEMAIKKIGAVPWQSILNNAH
jgi:hypothetical protein